MKLDRNFYEREDVMEIAREMIGKLLVTKFRNQITSGMIVEAEAYCGATDRASHAFRGLTPRNRIMFEKGGLAYVYLCYGIHHLFNVVTNQENHADAVLIRAIEPVDGLELMARRRKMDRHSVNLTSGPGKLSSALGISTKHNGLDLLRNKIWIEEGSSNPEDRMIGASRRIGVNYAGEDANLLWRFFQKESKYVGRKGQYDELHPMSG